MILSIYSDNPNFSHLIGKNPNSPPKLRRERKGVACGWYHNNKYCIKFIDDDDEVSYPDYPNQEFEFLARGRYCSPFLAYKLVTQFMTLNEQYDVFSNNEIEIHSLDIKDSSLALFEKYTDLEFGVEESPHWPKFKSLKILYRSSFDEFLSLLKVVLFYLSLDNERIFHDSVLVKNQFENLNKINAPYFIRYLFKTNYCRNSPVKFEEIKELLNSEVYYFCPYNNFEARAKWITDQVKDKKVHVYDIGCAEGRYIKRLSQGNLSYTGVDPDKDSLEKAKKKAQRLDIKTSFKSSIDDILPDQNSIVVLSEVIEHIEDYEGFLSKLNTFPCKILITTPNRAFNEYYQIELRHEDHVREFTIQEIMEWYKFFPNRSAMIENIGDEVCEEPTTFGVIINA